MFLDLFAFIFPALLLIFGVMIGKASISDLGRIAGTGQLSPFAGEIYQL